MSSGCDRTGKQTLPKAPGNLSKLVEQGGFPNRVHAFEDYDTDIEKRWWMSGKAETKDVPPGGRSACRGVLTQDFDDRQGDTKTMYRAVIFNPVPGPPMGKNTRLSFRYKLHGTDTLRVQLYSLTNGYHRYLSLKGLPQDRWESGTVDMTQMRRPDGSGGPLARTNASTTSSSTSIRAAELLIDDIVLYDAAVDGEKRPFPKHILYTGWFRHRQAGQGMAAAISRSCRTRSRVCGRRRARWPIQTGEPWIRLSLRGERPAGGGDRTVLPLSSNRTLSLRVELAHSKSGLVLTGEIKEPPRRAGRRRR